MMKLREAGERVMGRLQAENDQMQFDPATIMVIIEAIRILLPLFTELCDRSIEDLPKFAGQLIEPATLGERISYRMARRSLIRGLGWDDYMEAGGDKMLQALLRETAETDVNDLWQLRSSTFILGG